MREGSVKLIKLTGLGELIIGTVKTEEHDDLVSSFRNTNDFLRMNIYISSPATIIEDEDSVNVYPWIYGQDVRSDNWILLNALNVICIAEPTKEIYDAYVKYLSGAVTEPIM